MLGVTIFWDQMLKKTDVEYVEEMGVHVKLSKVFSMTHCPEEVSVKAFAKIFLTIKGLQFRK